MQAIDNHIFIDPEKPDPAGINHAADLLRKGKVIILPTRGLYGLAADALNPDAVARIFTIKNRIPTKPVLVLIDDAHMLAQVAQPVNAMARGLMKTFWPGMVTFIVAARPGLPTGLTGGSGKIGIRLVSHPVARRIVQATGRPLTGTSANPTGVEGAAETATMDPGIVQAVDLIVDSGSLAGGIGSTVVDVSGIRPEVIREGAVPEKTILSAFKSLGF